MVQVGQPAPDFTATAVVKDQFVDIKLSDHKGKWVVLFFWPLDFTFICPTEIKAFSNAVDRFAELGADILGCSTDSKFSHLAWTETETLGKVNFPMVSDFTKDISRDYGILVEDLGAALRGLFIIDPDGILQYQVVHSLNIGRNVDEVIRVLKALQTGELCPINWDEGEDTLGKA
jgi:peroxiredoxin 2/4